MDAEFYRFLFENMQESFVLTQVVTNDAGEVTDYRFLEMNATAERHLNLSRAETIGHLRSELLGPLDEETKREIQSVAFSGSAMRTEKYIAAAGGWFNVYAYSPKPGYIASLSIDITEQKNAEAALQELNEDLEYRVLEKAKEISEFKNLLNDIIRNYSQGSISVVDRDLKYVFVGGASTKLLKFEDDELVGKRVFPLMSEESYVKIMPALMRVFEGETITNKDMPGSYSGHHFAFDAFPLKTANGSIARIAIMTRNITELKKAQFRLEEAFQREKEMNELKSRFVSVASHEFRTPLTAILSSVSLINAYDKEEDKEKRAKHIARIKSSVQTLLETLDDFLSLDKLEQNKIEIAHEPLDFQVFANEIADEIGGVLKPDQRIELSYTGTSEILHDKKVLKHIILNLLSNAVKFSGASTTVYLTIEVLDNVIRIIVKDEGIGIPEEEQGQIFSNFYRAKNANNVQGTGLGLNIVKKYVEILKGGISFSSKLNKGTTFTVELPVVQS